MRKFITVAVLAACTGLAGGCQFSLNNEKIEFAAFPTPSGEEPAWKIGAESPQFKAWAAIDGEKTATQVIDGIKGVADSAMGLPIFSLVGDLFDGSPKPAVAGG